MNDMTSEAYVFRTPTAHRKSNTVVARRRVSLDNILCSEHNGIGSGRTGSLRLRARIPIVDAGGQSPLRQLQRMKENEHVQTLTRGNKRSTPERSSTNAEQHHPDNARNGCITITPSQTMTLPADTSSLRQPVNVVKVEQPSNMDIYANKPVKVEQPNNMDSYANKPMNVVKVEQPSNMENYANKPAKVEQPNNMDIYANRTNHNTSQHQQKATIDCAPPPDADTIYVPPSTLTVQDLDTNGNLHSEMTFNPPAPTFTSFTAQDTNCNHNNVHSDASSDTSSIYSNRSSMKNRPAVPPRRGSVRSNAANKATSPGEKPVVVDVHLIQAERSRTPSVTANSSRSTSVSDFNAENIRRSTEDLDGSSIASDIYSDLKPVINLMKSKSEARCSFLGDSQGDGAIYSNLTDAHSLKQLAQLHLPDEIYDLPQPQCYSDNTLKAVKKITEKYDTLQRRKMRAMSFRENGKYTGFSEPNSPVRLVSPDSVLGATLDSPFDNTTGMTSSQSHDNVFRDSSFFPDPPPPLPSCGVDVDVSAFDVVDSYTHHVAEDSHTRHNAVDGFTHNVIDDAHTRQDDVVDEYTPTGVTVGDIARLDLFYRSRGTEVTVCQCLADLSMGTADPVTGEVSKWEAARQTGVPVLVFNTGVCRRRRELHVTLAERETGFPLWTDRINYLSNYRVVEASRHVLQLSDNLRRIVSLKFYCSRAAAAFMDAFRSITRDPNDDLWKIGGNIQHVKKRRFFSFRRSKSSKAPPKKGEISRPCNFEHITNIDPKNTRPK